MTITWQNCVEALDGDRSAWADEHRRFLEHTHVVDGWWREHFERAARREYKFTVRHNGQTIDIWSVSAKEAVNVIRLNLYDKTPERNLPPFEVKAYLPNIANAVTKVVGNSDATRKRTATPSKINLLAQRLMKFAR